MHRIALYSIFLLSHYPIPFLKAMEGAVQVYRQQPQGVSSRRPMIVEQVDDEERELAISYAPHKAVVPEPSIFDQFLSYFGSLQLRKPEAPVVSPAPAPTSMVVNVNLKDISAPNLQQPQPSASMPPLLESKSEETTSWHNQLTQWIVSNKLAALAYTSVGIYVGIQGYLLYLIHKLNHPLSWSKWKAELTLGDLWKMKQAELTKLLSQDISCICKDTQTFARQIENEIASLNGYATIMGLLKTSIFHYLFAYDTSLYESVAQKIIRLNFLKNVMFKQIVAQK